MSRFRRELSQVVRPRPVTELYAEGVTRHVLAGPRWRRTGPGHHVPAAGEGVTPTQRIVEAAARMPSGAVLGGWAAAFVHGADLLDGLDDHTMRRRQVVVLVPRGLHLRSGPEVRFVRRDVDPADIVPESDIPCTSPVVTAWDLARWAPNLTESVVALDVLLQAGVVTMRGLRESLPRLGQQRGVAQARRAGGLCRVGAASSWETRLRMAYVLDLGFPQPRVNTPVFSSTGRFLGRPDLLDVEAGLVMEFDGARWTSSTAAGHRDVRQHREDNVREELFERARLIVVRADSGDLRRHRVRLLERLTTARAEGVRRDRRLDGWTLEEPPGWAGF